MISTKNSHKRCGSDSKGVIPVLFCRRKYSVDVQGETRLKPRNFGDFQRYPQSAYRDVHGVKVTTKRLRFALHRPFSPLYTDASSSFVISYRIISRPAKIYNELLTVFTFFTTIFCVLPTLFTAIFYTSLTLFTTNFLSHISICMKNAALQMNLHSKAALL